MPEIRLPAYCHEWRAVAPNNKTVALYEAARLRAIQVNYGADDLSHLITMLEKWANGNEEVIEVLADTTESYLSNIGEQLGFIAMIRNDLSRAKEYYFAEFMSMTTGIFGRFFVKKLIDDIEDEGSDYV